MLTLNAITESRPEIPVALFQFALDPEDEAQQVAARIVADGKRYGMTLLPDNEGGRRVQAAFDTQLRELGGAVVATRFYDVAAKVTRCRCAIQCSSTKAADAPMR